MRLIIFGSRDFKDYKLLKEKVDDFIPKHLTEFDEEVIIISGKARGGDNLGEVYAKERCYRVEDFPANWGKYGNAAGMKRNKEMAKVGTHAIGFWDGRSPGTRDMIEKCKIHGLIHEVVVKR